MDEYGLLSKFYDLLLTPMLIGMRRTIIEFASETEPSSVVDLCCGTGHQLKLMKKYGFRRLTCVDISDAMLKEASRGPHAPECLLKDASDTGLPAGSADLVIISLALHEKPACTAADVIAEAERLLRIEGTLLVSDYSCDADVPVFSSAAVRFIEGLVGGEHYRNYLDYVISGGLDSILTGSSFREIARKPAAAGAISVRMLRKG